MCFSAVASFSAAAVLGTAGLVSLKSATKKSQLMFAAIPILFGVQQAIEGMLWLSFLPEDYLWRMLTTYAFLFFAQVLWCTWVPLSMLSMEKEKIRRTGLGILTCIGLITSALLGYRLMTSEVSVKIDNHHISYYIASDESYQVVTGTLYLISVVLPCFASGVKGLRAIGCALIVALLASWIFYDKYLISVWCFFAAILSGFIVYVMRNFQKDKASSSRYKQISL